MAAASTAYLAPGLLARTQATLPPLADWKKTAEIRDRISLPRFPARDFLVTEFGAVGDGKTVNTSFIREAITACNGAGGGRVVIPPGDFLTGPVHLASNVNLHVAEGATLLFSKNPGDYLPLVQTWFEGVELMNYSPFIYAFGAENVALTGGGILDGQADFDDWWSWRGPRAWKGMKSGSGTGWKEGMPYQKASRGVLMEMAAKGVPVQQRKFGEGHYLRSAMVEFNRCTRVFIEGVTLQRAPFWSVHPVLSTNVTARGLKIENPVGANADGIDPECCSGVLIEHCTFDTGDDCISLKSGRDHDGRRLNTPCRDVVIAGCHFSSERSALSCGSESSGGIRNIYIENVTAGTVFRFFRIKTNTQRGGVNENIHIRHARIEKALENFVEIQTNFNEPLKDLPGVTDAQKHIPVIQNISLADIDCGPAGRALNLPGTSDTPIRNLELRRIKIGPVANDNILTYLENPISEDVIIGGEEFTF